MMSVSKKDKFKPNDEVVSFLCQFVWFTTQNSNKYKKHKNSISFDVLDKLKRGEILTGKHQMYQSNTCRLYRDALIQLRSILQDDLNQTAPRFLEGGVLHYSNFLDFGSIHWVKPNINVLDVIHNSNRGATLKGHMVWAYRNLLLMLQKKLIVNLPGKHFYRIYLLTTT